MKIPIKAYWQLLSKYLKSQLLWVLMLGAILLSSVGLQLVNPQIVRFFIDAAASGKTSDVLIKTAIIFIAIIFLQQLLALAKTYLGKRIGWKATNDLRNDLTYHCLNLDMEFHKNFKPGELIERIDGDVTILLNFFSQFVLILVNNIILVFGVLILLYREDWRIGIAQTVYVIIGAIVLTRVQKIAVPYWKSVREISGKFYGFVGENISSTEDIASNGAKGHVMYQFYGYLQRWFPMQKKALVRGWGVYMTTLAIVALGNSIAFGMGGYLWYKGIITMGTIFLFYNYTTYLTGPIDAIRGQLQDLQKASASITRVQELFNMKSKIIDGTEVIECKDKFDISVNNVTFNYEEGINVLKNVSFELPQGKIIGVLGRTGSGKTTLSKLFLRLYDYKKGEIVINGKPIKSLRLENLRENIAYVTQDVQLFHATIRDNVTFFNNSIKDDEIINLIEDIGLAKWYKALPSGLDTILSSDGSGLSAGEAQLLALVRVFLKNPSLIILDEASSRLDPITEELMQNAISKLLKGRSAIIIAHRLWTVNCADDILILDNGEIIEYGSREALQKDSESNYYRLLRTGIEEVLA